MITETTGSTALVALETGLGGRLDVTEPQRRRDLKKCRMWFPVADHFADRSETFRNFFFGDHFAIDLNALAISDEVRGGEQSGVITLGAANGVDHRADRAFAVCAGDVEDALPFRGNIQLAEKALNVLQSELDPETLRAVKPGKRILVGGGDSGLSRVHCVAEK